MVCTCPRTEEPASSCARVGRQAAAATHMPPAPVGHTLASLPAPVRRVTTGMVYAATAGVSVVMALSDASGVVVLSFIAYWLTHSTHFISE